MSSIKRVGLVKGGWITLFGDVVLKNKRKLNPTTYSKCRVQSILISTKLHISLPFFLSHKYFLSNKNQGTCMNIETYIEEIMHILGDYIYRCIFFIFPHFVSFSQIHLLSFFLQIPFVFKNRCLLFFFLFLFKFRITHRAYQLIHLQDKT